MTPWDYWMTLILGGATGNALYDWYQSARQRDEGGFYWRPHVARLDLRIGLVVIMSLVTWGTVAGVLRLSEW